MEAIHHGLLPFIVLNDKRNIYLSLCSTRRGLLLGCNGTADSSINISAY